MFLSANENNIASVLGSIIEVTDWMSLGLLLGLPSHKLVRISQDGRERLQRMVSLWLDSGTASWRALVQALFDPLITEAVLARRISKEHRLLESSNCMHNQSIHNICTCFSVVLACVLLSKSMQQFTHA